MEPVEYIDAFRRRWWVIALCVLVAGGVAFVTTATTSSEAQRRLPAASAYSATALLWNPAVYAGIGGGDPITDLNTLAALVPLPEVADRAAQIMHYQGRPTDLVSKVVASASVSTRRHRGTPFLDITGTDSDPQQAELIATAFSQGLIGYLGDLKRSQIDQQVHVLHSRLAALIHQKDTTGAIQSTKAQLTNLATNRSTPISLSVIQKPNAEVVGGGGLHAPQSRAARMTLALIGGLIAGLILALVLERFDTRIRTRDAAEEAFGVPLLGELPTLSRSEQRGIVTIDHPVSDAADAFHLFAAALRRRNGDDAISILSRSEATRAGVRTILVTSPEPGDGKTTVAANLAAIYAQTGKRVFALSCDLRGPSMERLFGVDDVPGVTDALSSMDVEYGTGPWNFAPYVARPQGTTVAVMPSGSKTTAPGELLRSDRMQSLIEGAKKVADVVVLDCVAMTSASDVVPLLPQADAVVIVARAGKTRIEVAERSTELLQDLGASISGVVLNRAKERGRRGRAHRRDKKQPAKRTSKPDVQEPGTGPDPERDMWVGRG